MRLIAITRSASSKITAGLLTVLSAITATSATAHAEAMPHPMASGADTFSFFGETIMHTLGLGGPDTVAAYKIWALPFSPYALLLAVAVMITASLCIRRAQRDMHDH